MITTTPKKPAAGKPAPLPEIPDSLPGWRNMFLTLEVTGSDGNGQYARRRFSTKPPIYIPRDVAPCPSGTPWASVFFVPVWFYRSVKAKL